MSLADEMDVQDMRLRPPLGLPTGSVRAVLTLLTLGLVVHETVLGRDLSMIWIETLLIALAHYFTSRRFVRLPYEVRRQLEADGTLPKEAHPLFLPAFTIRIIILATVTGLGVYLYKQGRLFEHQAMLVLFTLPAFLLGVIIRGTLSWLTRSRKSRLACLWDDFVAVSVLLAYGGITIIYFVGGPQLVPLQLQGIAVSLALFYFGSR